MTTTFKIGDMVVITQKADGHNIVWVSEMNSTINSVGEIFELYRNGAGYKVRFLTGATWTYLPESLKLVEESYTFDSFNVDDEVLVLKKTEDRGTLNTGWIDGEMDDLIGHTGVVIETDDNDSTILVYFEETGAQWWFPYEALSKNLSATQRPDECLDLWFLGRYSGLPYKAISPDGPAYIIENELGEQFSSKYMRLDCAPKECKSFSYRR